MGFLTGFLDSVVGGLLGPKGDLADWQHASKLYITENQKLAPKYKFLYHVTFYLTEDAKSKMPELQPNINEIGMLVKSCDLPKFTAQVEAKKKYNRTKHFQTGITYNGINITFHDDNYGLTTALLEAYYKYYFADSHHPLNDGSYGRRTTGDTTYDGPGNNKFKFGLDNNIPSVPFFDKIEISQLHRRQFTRFTLVNPIISSWNHDNLNNSEGGGVTENSISVEYDAVLYDRGNVSRGGDPTGMGSYSHYDVSPSPLSLQGGGGSGLDSILGGGADLYNYITTGQGFTNPFEAAIAAANLVGNVRDLDSNDLKQGGLSVLRDSIGAVGGIDVSGVPLTTIPKSGGNGGDATTTVAAVALAGTVAAAASSSAQTADGGNANPQQADDAAYQTYLYYYQSSGGTGGVNAARTSWNALPDSEKEKYK